MLEKELEKSEETQEELPEETLWPDDNISPENNFLRGTLLAYQKRAEELSEKEVINDKFMLEDREFTRDILLAQLKTGILNLTEQEKQTKLLESIEKRTKAMEIKYQRTPKTL